MSELSSLRKYGREIMRLRGDGLQPWEVATRLNLSPSTVYIYEARIRRVIRRVMARARLQRKS